MNSYIQIPPDWWKFMRITFSQLLIALSITCVSLAHDGRGQQILEREVSFAIKKGSIEQVLTHLEKELAIRFVYSKSIVDTSRPVRVQVKNAALGKMLDKLLNPLDIDYQVVGNHIVLRKRAATGKAGSAPIPVPDLPAVPEDIPGWAELNLRDIHVRGRVAGEDGEGLPGVSIIVKGENRGTVTNEDGSFELFFSNNNAVLVFSFVGYESREVKIGNETSLDVVLVVDNKALNEVVVVGYGTQKRANLTGAVSTVESKDIENRPVSNLANALQGTTPGLVITRNGGQPGNENINLQLRGATSANGNIPPLLLVDGVTAPIFTLQTINPNDVESISVLKDASAAAIYGAQAAGGVVLITTKKGKGGKTVFEYSSLFGVDWALNVPKRLTLIQEAGYINLSRANAGLSPEYSEFDIDNINRRIPYAINPADTTKYLFYNQEDHVKAVMRAYTPMQTHNFSARGGNDKLNYLVSLGYYDKSGVFKVGPDGLKRYNARLNLGAALTNHISFDSRIAYTLQKQEMSSRNADGGLLYEVYRNRLRQPIFTPEGRLNGGGASTGMNAYATLTDGGYNHTDRNYFDGIFTLKAAGFVKGLELRAVYGTQYWRNDQEIFRRTVPLWQRYEPFFYLNNPNSFDMTRGVTVNKNFQFLTDYDFSLGGRHNFHLLAGFQWEDIRNSSLFSSASNLVSNDLPTLNLGNNATKVTTQTISAYAYQSYFGRLNYNYEDKYLFEATVRIDESSRLAPGLRRKTFPAASMGWNMHKEEWLGTLLPFVSELKARFSWGQLGSALGSNIGNYDYLNLLTAGSSLILGEPEALATYFYQARVPSSRLSWETLETTNFGVDLGFLTNRLQLTWDYYVKYNRNMLTPLLLPGTFGVSTPNINNGSLKSWGWEIQLNYRGRTSGNFSYSVGFNLADNQNKLISYAGRRVINSGIVSILEGYGLNSIWAYKTDGYFSSADEVKEWAFQDNRTGPGDVRYLDLNGDNLINAGRSTPEDHGDLVYMGTENPRLNFGFNGNVSWKGIDFSVFFQGVGKRTFLPHQSAIMPYPEGYISPYAIHMDYWTPENPDAFFPRPYLQGYHNYLRADKWILNGQYIRLKNIQLGYSFPQKILEKLKLNRARVFFSGQDLWTASRMGVFNAIFNPESRNNTGQDYPFFATASLGLNLSF